MKASHIHVIAIFVNKNSIKKKKAKPENSTSWNPLDPEHTRGG